MANIEDTLSELEEGAFIEFKYYPPSLCLGLGPEEISAKFVGWDPKKRTMTYKNFYFEFEPSFGPERTIEYKRVGGLKKRPSGDTGPM